MSLIRAIEDLNIKSLKSLVPDTLSDDDKHALNKKIKELVGTPVNSKQAHNVELIRYLRLLEAYEKQEETSGIARYFEPGTPYGIDHLPKHKAFFDATRDYRETMVLGGNRTGKTTLGAFVVAVLATGLYPEWWEGVRYNTSTSIWAVGKTGQSTRDTVQQALMGPLGSWGTGMLPADSIVRTTARQGISGALDIVEVKNVFGGTSTIGFKSYDQKLSSFVGTAKHVVWLDEPAPDPVYHECLVRTLKIPQEPVEGPAGGRLIYTQTPKEGLTRLTAEFLASCDLLAGAERIKGLDTMLKLQELEDAKERESGI